MTIQQKEQTTFKDLTWVCKVGIIGGWIISAIYTAVIVVAMTSP